MTYKEKSSYNSLTWTVNNLLKKSLSKQKVLRHNNGKEKSLIRHLDRNERSEWSESSPNFACKQVKLNVSKIHQKNLINKKIPNNVEDLL